MLRAIYVIIKDFGVLGAVFASTGINIFLFYKLFTNHLHHLALQIEDVNEKCCDIEKEITPIKERISKIEGMLD